MNFTEHLGHAMFTFREITSVTFGEGEAAMTVELREASEYTPKGWHSVDANGTSQQFVVENGQLSSFQILLANAKSAAEHNASQLQTLTAEFDS